MNKLKITVSISLIFILLGCKEKQDTLHWNGLLNKNLKEITIESEEKPSAQQLLSASTKNQKIRIVLRQEENSDATRLWRGIETTVDSFFTTHQSPYPGVLSQAIVCPDKYKPQKFDNQTNEDSWKEGFVLYSNDRLAIGSCDPASLAYRMLYAVMYCKKLKKSFMVKIFADDIKKDFSDLKQIFANLECEK